MRSCLYGVAENEPSWRPHVMAALPIGIPDGHQIVIYGRLVNECSLYKHFVLLYTFQYIFWTSF